MVASRSTTPEIAPKRLLHTVQGKASGRMTTLMLAIPPWCFVLKQKRHRDG
jgi:hypothetical protein